MSINYISIYNNLIKLTTNKNLYKGYHEKDTFSDRLVLFLLHFAFFLKVYKKKENKKVLQEIYDFNFRQLELSLREIGYGDQSINKKMKDYINFFHDILSEVHYWDELDINQRTKKLLLFLSKYGNIDKLVKYFEDFNDDLSKKPLNLFIKSVSNQ